jgi:hypothetical protein
MLLSVDRATIFLKNVKEVVCCDRSTIAHFRNVAWNGLLILRVKVRSLIQESNTTRINAWPSMMGLIFEFTYFPVFSLNFTSNIYFKQIWREAASCHKMFDNYIRTNLNCLLKEIILFLVAQWPSLVLAVSCLRFLNYNLTHTHTP